MKWIRENLEATPSFMPYLDYLTIIEDNVITNPTLCVETCKALIEGVCKTILINRNIVFSETIKFHALVGDTIAVVIRTDDTSRSDIMELGRRIAAVAHKLGEIRNSSGFVSHGMDVLNPRLTETLAKFASRVTDTIAGFILNCYGNNRAANPDHRIHYEDCTAFNEYFDELNPLNIGVVTISASAALFEQDPEVYKETYFSYLENMATQAVELQGENSEL
ncbi:MAG: abortive infection family protein [Turneriella sp.]